MTSRIDEHLQGVLSTIHQHEKQYSRPPGSVTLLAVSKTKPVAAIETAIAAGQRRFGENYVDEALRKIEALGHATDDGEALEWHFIGAIQSRKARDIATHFDWAHGVDRMKVAEKLSNARMDTDLPPLNICLQIALDDEPGKAGIAPEALTELATAVVALPGLKLRGLMAIPAPRTELKEQREVFARLSCLLHTLARQHPDMDTLSCGMSGDLEAAIAEGATIVRVGTAIFGAREKHTA